MTKAEQARVTAWRLKILRWAEDEPRQWHGRADTAAQDRIESPDLIASSAEVPKGFLGLA